MAEVKGATQTVQRTAVESMHESRMHHAVRRNRSDSRRGLSDPIVIEP
jgi:hypothetical protein